MQKKKENWIESSDILRKTKCSLFNQLMNYIEGEREAERKWTQANEWKCWKIHNECILPHNVRKESAHTSNCIVLVDLVFVRTIFFPTENYCSIHEMKKHTQRLWITKCNNNSSPQFSFFFAVLFFQLNSFLLFVPSFC